MIKVAFYDAKEYDKVSFEHYGEQHDIQFRFFETKLNEDTVELAKGSDNSYSFQIKNPAIVKNCRYLLLISLNIKPAKFLCSTNSKSYISRPFYLKYIVRHIIHLNRPTTGYIQRITQALV